MIRLFVAILQPALVAAKLLLDLGGSLVAGLVRIMRFGVALQDKPLHHVQYDVAGKGARPGLAERHVAGDGPVEIFLDHAFHPVAGMILQGCARFDLVTGNANIHGSASPLLRSETRDPGLRSRGFNASRAVSGSWR